MALASAGAQSVGTPRSPSHAGVRSGSRSTTPSLLEKKPEDSFRKLRPGLQKVYVVTDLSSDVGRKRFGFSHEELDDSVAYFEGQFKLHQRYGDGVMHNPETGAKYVGQFQKDVFHGEGDNIWSDGSRYVGQWRNGQKHGRGRYTSPEGLTYDGQWESGLRHGNGSQEYANNDKYEGGWWHGMCSGPGTYHFADGSKYEGAWANGRYEGSGTYVGMDGSRERQWYSNGLLMKFDCRTSSRSKSTHGRRSSIRGSITGGSRGIDASTRFDMNRPALLNKQQPSKYLILRETGGIDLSAPPLTPKLTNGTERGHMEARLASTDPPPLRAPAR